MACILCCLAGCKLPQEDLEDFVETGLTNVLVRSTSFTPVTESLGSIPSSETVTANVVIINPKAFDVTYTLGWNVDDSLFATAPATSPSPKSATRLTFSFVLDPAAAEHKKITFSLGKYVKSINKTYDPEHFSITCDSVPNPVSRLATVMDSNQKSVLAIILPTETSDDDLQKLKVTWTQETSSSSKSATYSISSLKTVPAPDPFASSYDCYFQSPDCVAGFGYDYSVAVIDAAGQESSSVSTSSTANVFYLSYDGNGSTGGSVTAKTGYRYGGDAVVAEQGSLVRTDYAFDDWNTAADGSGTSYAEKATLSMPAADVILYAQWYTNTTTITFDIGTQALVFDASVKTIAKGGTLEVETTNATLDALDDWTWYINGVAITGETDSSLSYDTSTLAVGSYTISAVVADASTGLSYSGHFKLTVTD